jgi:hypothetical protein
MHLCNVTNAKQEDFPSTSGFCRWSIPLRNFSTSLYARENTHIHRVDRPAPTSNATIRTQANKQADLHCAAFAHVCVSGVLQTRSLRAFLQDLLSPIKGILCASNNTFTDSSSRHLCSIIIDNSSSSNKAFRTCKSAFLPLRLDTREKV